MSKFKQLKQLYKGNVDAFLVDAYNNRVKMGYTLKEMHRDINKILGTHYGESTLRCRADYLNRGKALAENKPATINIVINQ